MSSSGRPPITCHVLDTTTGRPAANMAVTLRCMDLPAIIFVGTTNGDGRIVAWENKQGANGSTGAYVRSKGGVQAALYSIIGEFAINEQRAEGSVPHPMGTSFWKLQFDTGAHYGMENTFFPTVELSFLVKPDEHFHVPLLLGPYSFTTYRGS